ncbi:MAG: hypothetical protein AAF494_00655 [Pseudomonadota bacterium]
MSKPARGYLMSEDDELLQRRQIGAMRGIAALIEGREPGNALEHLAPDEIAAIFYSLAESGAAINRRVIFIDLPD